MAYSAKEIVLESIVSAMSNGDAPAWQSFLIAELKTKGLKYELGESIGYAESGIERREYVFTSGPENDRQPVGKLLVESIPGALGPLTSQMKLEDGRIFLAKPDKQTLAKLSEGKVVIDHGHGMMELSPSAE